MVEGAQRFFGHLFGKIFSFQIAASPANDELPYGYGVAELLQFWTASLTVASQAVFPPLRPERAMGRLTVTAE
jgi:hypothetical protein